MFKVVHNADVSFVREAKRSELPVRIGVRIRLVDRTLFHFHVVATAVVGSVVHEYSRLVDIVPSTLLAHDEERSRTELHTQLEEFINKLKELLETEGLEVITGSFYECAGCGA